MEDGNNYILKKLEEKKKVRTFVKESKRFFHKLATIN